MEKGKGENMKTYAVAYITDYDDEPRIYFIEAETEHEAKYQVLRNNGWEIKDHQSLKDAKILDVKISARLSL